MKEVLIHTSDTFYDDPAKVGFDDAYDRASNMKQGYVQRVVSEGHKWGRLERDPKRFIVVRIEDHWFEEKWMDLLGDPGDEICDRVYRFPLKKILTRGEFEALVNIPYNDPTERPQIIKNVDLKTVMEVNNWDKRPPKIKLHGSAGDFSIQEDGGGDYTSLKTAVETEAADISGGSIDANFYITEIWTSADTGNWDIDGWTMGTNNMLIQTQGASRSSDGTYESTAYRIENTTQTFDIENANTTVDGIQATATVLGIERSSSAAATTIESCIINVASGTGRGILFNSGATSLTMNNCIIYKTKEVESTSNGIKMFSQSLGTNTLYNCTISGFNKGVAIDSGTSTTIKNFAVFNNDNDFSATATIDYCASDDGDGTNAVDISPGGTEADDWANAFTDWSNGDFSVKDASSVLYNAGTNTGAPSDDIMGTSRPQASTVDIGAFEFIAAVGGQSLPSRVLTGPFEGPLGGPL